MHSYAVDNLQLLTCAGAAYEKASGDPDSTQDKKETLYLKQQRVSSLVARYKKVEGDSAYDLGLAS